MSVTDSRLSRFAARCPRIDDLVEQIGMRVEPVVELFYIEFLGLIATGSFDYDPVGHQVTVLTATRSRLEVGFYLGCLSMMYVVAVVLLGLLWITVLPGWIGVVGAPVWGALVLGASWFVSDLDIEIREVLD